MAKPKCSMCKELRGEAWTDEKCAECLPMLFDENEEAARIYLLVYNQFIMGPQGPIAINQIAVHEAMKLYRIKERQQCFEKVLSLSAYFIRDMIAKSGI